jgi:hypothetical protein
MTTLALAPSTVRINGRLFPFTSYADVSKAFRKARDASGAVSQNGILHGRPVAPPCEILDGSGECIAWVSYNGRIWRGPLHNNNYDLVYDAGRNA